MADPWPLELLSKQQGRILNIRFDTGESFDLEAEYLRVESPSAEVKGHGPGQERLDRRHHAHVTHRADRALTHRTVEHRVMLGLEHDTIWPAYLEKLAKAGQGRG